LPETEDLNVKVSKMQKDIEEIKVALREDYYENPDKYKKRLDDVLSKRKESPLLWLQIDGFRSINEIELDLKTNGQEVPHTNIWRASEDMRKAGVVVKIGVKKRSPIYDKKLWAKELDLDTYVKDKYGLK